MKQLYRKSSIERLSNPDQLDRRIKISSTMSWLALLGVLMIIVATIIWSFVGNIPSIENVSGIVAKPANVNAVFSDASGSIISILKYVGDVVKKGDKIALVKCGDGKEISVVSDIDGKLSDILVQIGSPVFPGAEIARITPNIEQEQVVVCYVPLVIAQKLQKDMRVLLYPVSIDSQKYGHMEAWIDSVEKYAANTGNLWYVLGNDNLVADQFLSSGPVVAVVCRLRTDSSTKSGFFWSSEKGNELIIPNGSVVSAKIIIEETTPISKLLNHLR